MTGPRTRLKMCGMTQAADIAYAVDLGVDAIGLIFYQHSARHVSIADATLLLRDLPAFVDVVAVFVNPEPSLVHEVITELPVQWLQFHGEEPPQFCRQFARPYIKAIPATSAEAIIQAAADYQDAGALLLDTPSATQRGGSGVAFDWQVIPQQVTKPIILAGGLNLHNVQEAVMACSPYAIDLCSGIEATAGIKDHNKMRQLVNVLWGEA